LVRVAVFGSFSPALLTVCTSQGEICEGRANHWCILVFQIWSQSAKGVGTAAPIFQNLTKIAFFSAVFAPLGRHCISIKLKFGWLGVGVGVPRIFLK